MAGGFGLAIILLTVIIRMIMWPLNTHQQRSMKKMQTLSPKLKEIQNRYKNNPQVMQQKMMEIYKENDFNPMGGCFPMLLQLPVFILLYSALMSPQFMQIAGNSKFLFVNRLDQTLKSTDAIPQDGKFSISDHDRFSTDKFAIISFDNGKTEKIKIHKPQQTVQVQGKITPGQTVDLKISMDDLDLKFSQLDKIKSAKINVINNSTREFETIVFKRNGDLLTASIPTFAAKASFNYDVLLLVALFGITMYLSQKIMMKINAQTDLDPAQQAMQKSMSKLMPIMIIGMFIFIPIPAGVFLYMITSNVIQIVQTVIVNKQIEAEEKTAAKDVIEAQVVDKENK
jgi:YidC/Oxa1 family membrane protein insertase